MCRIPLFAACLVSMMAGFALADDADLHDVDYLKEVKPLLTAKCVACHGPLRQRGRLRLDTAKFLVQGGESGSAIVAGDSAQSVLIEAVLGSNGRTKMPVDAEELKPEQIEVLRRWIDSGAKAPDDEPIADPREHWAFKKPVGQVFNPPSRFWQVENLPHNNPIDMFLAAEYQSRGLTPLPEADKPTLLRRVFLDLIGIPPTRDELHSFLNDNSPDAYEVVVDRLLESPLHAQRWAKHWMDIWRYSDWYGSRGGNELRNSRRHIWRWRDWIIESLKADKGYDRMIHEMLAADEIAPGDRDMQRASGFLGRNYYVFNRHVWLQDTVEYTGAAFLGLSFKCCRCHDHKYDPLAQEEYFRFRAFFEPHNVRTDRLVGKPELITGNWPAGAFAGATLKDGADVVFDADLSAATYLLERGNEKNPVTEKPLAPGVPAVFGATDLKIEPIALPVEAYYPDFRPERREELLANAHAAITRAEVDAVKARDLIEAARQKLTERESRSASGKSDSQTPPFLDDQFTAHRTDVWKVLSGDWQFAEGKLSLKAPGHFTTIATLQNHPRDFKATLKYRTLAGGSVGSIGLFFDVVELKHAQAVYTHINASSSGVQAFHRQNGQEAYPAAGIVNMPLKLNEEITLEITACGPELNIWINGELKLTYTMPVPRQPGRFALWCHAGLAEFTSLRITAAETTRDELQLAVKSAESAVALTDKQIEIARAEAKSVEARIAAEVAKYMSSRSGSRETSESREHRSLTTSATAFTLATAVTLDEQLARDASRAERTAALAKAELEALQAEQQFHLTKNAVKPDDIKTQVAIKAAETKLNAAKAAIEIAKTNAVKEDTTYMPLGPTYPTTSSGRRLALACWLTSPDNPLTARVAVNHIWKRHFGTALVPSVANFGLNGKKPTHPALLDWLAVEFMESGWSQRRLHRLMVTSAAYRRESSDTSPTLERGTEAQAIADLEPSLARRACMLNNAKLDPDNRHYWRANSRRMEAEVVRDSLLSLTGCLDSSFGGPELEPATADASPRRSLYFRLTPDDQATMLELFDGPLPAECFERSESIVPQQALSLVNSPVALTQSRLLARILSEAPSDADFIRAAFEAVLTRAPSNDELASSEKFLQRQAVLLVDPNKLTRTTTGLATSVPPSTDPRLRARENLVHVLLNHQDFVTIR